MATSWLGNTMLCFVVLSIFSQFGKKQFNAYHYDLGTYTASFNLSWHEIKASSCFWNLPSAHLKGDPWSHLKKLTVKWFILVSFNFNVFDIHENTFAINSETSCENHHLCHHRHRCHCHHHHHHHQQQQQHHHHLLLNDHCRDDDGDGIW